MQVYKIREIDLDSVVYSKPKGKKDRKVIIIGYRDSDKGKILPLIFQTSELFCGNSVENVNFGNDAITHQLDVPIYCRSKKRTIELKNFLTKLNNKIINDATKYGSEWFNDTDELKYKSIIRKSENEGKEFENGILKLKFVDNDQFKTHVFDENKELVNPEKYLRAGSCYMRIMMEISAVWVSDGNHFGIATRVYQVGISKSSNPVISTETYAFIDESDEEIYNELVVETEIDPFDNDNNKNLCNSDSNSIELSASESSDDFSNLVNKMSSEENVGLNKFKRDMTELSMTDNDYPNVATESYA